MKTFYDEVQTFSGPGPAPVPGLSVRVNSQGSISLTREAYTALGSPKYVRFLVSRENRKIGITPALYLETSGAKIRHVSKNGQVEVAGRRVFRALGTTFREAYGRHDLEREGDMLVFRVEPGTA